MDSNREKRMTFHNWCQQHGDYIIVWGRCVCMKFWSRELCQRKLPWWKMMFGENELMWTIGEVHVRWQLLFSGNRPWTDLLELLDCLIRPFRWLNTDGDVTSSLSHHTDFDKRSDSRNMGFGRKRPESEWNRTFRSDSELNWKHREIFDRNWGHMA